MHRLLFLLEPERAHDLTLAVLEAWSGFGPLLEVPGRLLRVEDPRLRVRVFSLDFPNPLGLAAGLDKDARALGAWWALGFGFVEVGTLTPRPQEGNPRPRLFRLLEDGALINRMGFNNQGVERARERLLAFRRRGLPLVVGVNLGKGRDTPLERAVEDYREGIRALGDLADYLVVNVSSPNTPGLRTLQEGPYLRELLAGLRAEKPLLLKLAPDLSPEALEEAAGIAEEMGLAGLIATNTTLDRTGLRSPLAQEAGGVSGRPLAQKSLEALKLLRAATRLPLISVGGIFTAQDVWERLRLGASLVQAYTGFVYGGPLWPRRVLKGLLRILEAEGVRDLGEVVGRG